MTITRAQALLLLEPKLSQIHFDDAQKRAPEYTNYFNFATTKKATVTDFNMTGFGSPSLKGEGSSTAEDDPIFGNTKTYSPVRFALKYSVTQETIDHELYGQVQKMESALLESFNDHMEQIGILWLNNGFGTTNADGFTSTGFDSLGLFSTAHTRLDGGSTQKNRPSTDVDLGVTGLQNAMIDIRNWKSHRGRPVKFTPKLLVISPEDEMTAKELLQSEYKPGTANNEINALRDFNLSYFVSSYKNDTDAWAVLCDQTDLRWIWDINLQFDTWDDKDAMVLWRRGVYGAITGHGEWYGTYGSQGA